ncbi:MAG TPA: MbnP family protein [Archangium sp.]|uniref:MbnP family protein n=1 Tax=Archangium sp. TaxID=1872627 RepID=UPI002E33825B|nr:MbnP family protein [Archangium sp.]HEX5754449.1 MbnP family protein [Archangium sp.]
MNSKGETAVAVPGRFTWVGSKGRTTRLGVAVALASSLAIGCGDNSSATPETCLPPSTVDASAPITRLGVHFMAGTAPLLLGNPVTSSHGASFKTLKARLYLSQVALLGESGERVSAELVDAQGHRLPYGVTLLDLERPESLNVYVQAPAGNYRGMAVSIGVPESCGSGAKLNHSDASAMDAPLDVDSDMYWSWNPGYVFLKFEGQVQDSGAWKNFFFHVGEDKRFVALELDAPFTLTPEGGTGPELIADFNRLLVSPAGAAQPDITNDEQRRVHGGALADSLAENLRGSRFLRLEQEHH